MTGLDHPKSFNSDGPYYGLPSTKKEEIRGLFVLGVIATVLAFRGDLQKIVSPSGGNLGALVPVLALTWGVYAFFMTIGISDDIFKAKACRVCTSIAKSIFWLGTYYTSTLLVVVSVSLVFGQAWNGWLGILVSIIILLVMLVALVLATRPRKILSPSFP